MSAPADDGDDGDDGATPPVQSEIARQALIAVASALAAGITSVTFVAVVGGAVMMARLRGAGLPTEIGISVQPRPVLLGIGAETLAAAVAFAMVTVFVLHFGPWINRFVPEPAHPDARTARHRNAVTAVGRLVPKPVRTNRVWNHVLAASVALLGFVYYLGWSAGALRFPVQAGIAVFVFLLAAIVGYVCARLGARAVEARDLRHALA